MRTKPLAIVTAIITSLFITSASALAQVAPPTPAEAAGPGYTNPDTAIIMPKTKANLYLDAGLIYTNTKIGDQYHAKDSTDMYGLNVAFGWRIDQYNKIQVDLGILGSSEKDFGRRSGYANNVTYSAIPVLASYSFCIPLEKSRKWELRLTPTIGYYTIGAQYDYYLTGPHWVDGNETGGAFAWGGGAGVSYHINQRFHIDAGYRFLSVGSMSMKFSELESQATHSIVASFGWKF